MHQYYTHTQTYTGRNNIYNTENHKNPERPAHQSAQIKSTKQIPRHGPIAESLFTRNSNSDVSQGWYAHTPDNSTRQLIPKTPALDDTGSPR